jgi:hypothetical protein
MSSPVFTRRRYVTVANLEGAASVLTSSQDYRLLAFPQCNRIVLIPPQGWSSRATFLRERLQGACDFLREWNVKVLPHVDTSCGFDGIQTSFFTCWVSRCCLPITSSLRLVPIKELTVYFPYFHTLSGYYKLWYQELERHCPASPNSILLFSLLRISASDAAWQVELRFLCCKSNLFTTFSFV